MAANEPPEESESREEIESDFPKLRNVPYRIASDKNPRYNCVAFAAGDHERFWQNLGHPTKGYFWPHGFSDDETVDGWVRVFRLLNFEVSTKEEAGSGFEVIAIYGTHEGNATHVATRKGNDPWMSKLGKGHDIEHETLEFLECTVQHASEYEHDPCYGRVAVYMKRKRYQLTH